MKKIEYRKELNNNTYRPNLNLYIDGQPTKIAWSSELIDDARSVHGYDLADEVVSAIKAEINDQMLDIRHGLTQDEVDYILKITKEHLL